VLLHGVTGVYINLLLSRCLSSDSKHVTSVQLQNGGLLLATCQGSTYLLLRFTRAFSSYTRTPDQQDISKGVSVIH